MSYALLSLLIVVMVLLLDIRSKVGLKPRTVTLQQSVVIDTSAIIDGRIVEIADAGFLQGQLVIPKKVLDELQLLADGKDTHKRNRARHGLEAVTALQQLSGVSVVIDEYLADSGTLTDESVLQVAKKHSADICTTDVALNQVAAAEGVRALNVNELAQSLRPIVLPGEIIEVTIIQKGESRGQGVGYLEDGTMAVVDNAFRMKHKTIQATVDRMIQTKTGKMVFATYRLNN